MSTLSTPILSTQNVIDPFFDNTISFLYSDSQIKSKRLLVKDVNTLSIVYDNIQIGMKTSYELLANSILPGHYYIQVQVFDFDGNSSELSAPVLLYCYSTPIIEFENFPSKINKADMSVTLLYSQAQNDPIKEYVFYLYDNQKILLKQSEVFYSNSNRTYTFYGLENLKTYYIRCITQSIHGEVGDTDYCEVYVDYVVQPNNMIVKLENHPCDGYISITGNIIVIGYEVEGDSYEFKDGELILDNTKIIYNSGFNFSDEFSIFVKARKLALNDLFFTYNTSTGDVSLSIVEIANKYYCRMNAKSALGEYNRYVLLPNVALIDTDENHNFITDENSLILEDILLDAINNYIVVFEIKRKNNLYSLKIYYENDGYIEV